MPIIDFRNAERKPIEKNDINQFLYNQRSFFERPAIYTFVSITVWYIVVMTNNTLTQNYSTELLSEIGFLKKEVDFLMSMLRKSYSATLTMNGIRQLDRMWKGFEENIQRMEALQGLIIVGDKDDLNREKSDFSLDDESIISEFYRISGALRSVKENFYDYMSGKSGRLSF